MVFLLTVISKDSVSFDLTPKMAEPLVQFLSLFYFWLLIFRDLTFLIDFQINA